MMAARSALAILTCLLILCASVPAVSDESGGQAESAAPEQSKNTGTDETIPDSSPDAAKSKSVVFGERFGPSWDGRENWSDRGVSEFVINGGDYLGENWKNTYYVGGSYFYHINQTIALGAQYIYSPIVVDKDTPFYQGLESSDVHLATAQCMLNTPAAWRAGKRIFNMDFYFTLGAGAMRIDRQWETTGVIGGGAKIYFPVPWIAFRLDINSYIHMTPVGNRSDLSGDVSMGGGISFLFPSKRLD